MNRNNLMIIEGYCDYDYAGDNNSTRNITRLVIYFCGNLFCWKSKSQR